MDAETKLAYHRLSVLELAQTLDNVASACHQRGMSRTQFYEYKRRFQTHGLAGLKDLPPIHKSHPFTTPPVVVDHILAWNGAARCAGPRRLNRVPLGSEYQEAIHVADEKEVSSSFSRQPVFDLCSPPALYSDRRKPT